MLLLTSHEGICSLCCSEMGWVLKRVFSKFGFGCRDAPKCLNEDIRGRKMALVSNFWALFTRARKIVS